MAKPMLSNADIATLIAGQGGGKLSHSSLWPGIPTTRDFRQQCQGTAAQCGRRIPRDVSNNPQCHRRVAVSPAPYQ
jgi:hypothetical protein